MELDMMSWPLVITLLSSLMLCSLTDARSSPSLRTVYKDGYHNRNIPGNKGGWTKWLNVDGPGELGDNEMITDIIAKYGNTCKGFPCSPDDVIVAQVRLREGYGEKSQSNQQLVSAKAESCSIFDYEHLPTGHLWLYSGVKKPGKMLKIGDDYVYLGLDGARCLVGDQIDDGPCQDYEVRFFCTACPEGCCTPHYVEFYRERLEWISKFGLMDALRHI